MASPAPATRQTTVAPQAALGILSAISLCHGLNDLLQSVLPAVYPILKITYMLDFGQIGLITFTNTVTASLLQPVVGLHHGQAAQAVLAGDRDGLHAAGSAAALGGADVCGDPRGGRLRRHRLVHLPSRVVSSGAPRLRRPSRLRPVAVSSRRQRRLGDRTAARRLHRPAVRPTQHRVVRLSWRSPG